MSFVDGIRKVSIPRKRGILSELEKSGDPEALAAAFSNFSVEKELQQIAAPRASSLYSGCMRKQVIGTVFELKEPRWISLKGRIIFGIGNAVHSWLQNSPDLFGDNRYGWWKCEACGQTRYFGGPPKKPCEKCNARVEATVYLEHSMRIKKPYIVSGHPDMFVRPFHVKKLRLSEIKTLSGEEFDKLVAPIVDHEWQITTYQYFCSTDPSLPAEVDPSLGYIVYVTKKLRKDIFPMKIFPNLLNYDLLKRIKEKLGLYKKGLEDYPKFLPPLIEECERSKFEGYRARTCVALLECKKRK